MLASIPCTVRPCFRLWLCMACLCVPDPATHSRAQHRTCDTTATCRDTRKEGAHCHTHEHAHKPSRIAHHPTRRIIPSGSFPPVRFSVLFAVCSLPVLICCDLCLCACCLPPSRLIQLSIERHGGAGTQVRVQRKLTTHKTGRYYSQHTQDSAHRNTAAHSKETKKHTEHTQHDKKRQRS